MNPLFAGFGLGLRPAHFLHVLEHQPKIDWFEVISENYFVAGGKPKYFLSAVREQYPIAMHGVSLSIGSTDPLDEDYLTSLAKLVKEVQPMVVSDHACWTSTGGVNSHDLLPMPYNEASIDHVVGRVQKVQDTLGQRLLLENVSAYVSYKSSTMAEWDFLNEIAKQSGCGLLLDVNNVYVNERNLGIDSKAFIDGIDTEIVGQFHVAGHSDYGDYVIDTHDHPVCDAVFDLYSYACARFGDVPTMIERDDHIPAFSDLEAELDRLRRTQHSSALGSHSSHSS